MNCFLNLEELLVENVAYAGISATLFSACVVCL